MRHMILSKLSKQLIGVTIVALLAILALAGCQKSGIEEPAPAVPSVDTQPAVSPEPEPASPAEKSCDCTDEFDPVCADDQLFNNACTAECLGITDYMKGECHDPTGKQMFPCGVTTGGLSAQNNPVCAKVIEVDSGRYFWKTYPNAVTACQVDRAGKLDVKEFNRGEC